VRLICFLAISVGLKAEPLRWIELTPPMRALLRQAGMAETDYPAWQDRHNAITRERLAAGAAEHISYYLFQSSELIGDPPLDPANEARGYLNSLPAAERQRFLSGANSVTPIRDSVRRRIDAFWNKNPASERHRVLREMAKRLDWTPERVIFTAFRFLMRRSIDEDPNDLYQARGLSADPFPPSMRAVDRGLAWLRSNRSESRENIFLAGPGAELGSRFGVDDALPVISPQPKALLALLPKNPAVFDCADIRPEVVATLKNGPCRAFQLDLVTEKIQGGPYDLAVATNILVYLDDVELAVALSNLSLALRPGGCLLHNDSRFAARPFGAAAGIPVVHFESIPIGTRQGREQMDRIVVHCKTTNTP
jgi:hypothetical protein